MGVGQYYECPSQYFKSNIGCFSSMQHVLDRCFSLEVDLVSMGWQCCVRRLLWQPTGLWCWFQWHCLWQRFQQGRSSRSGRSGSCRTNVETHI